MLPHTHPIIERLRFEDGERAIVLRHHAETRQALKREEAAALADRARIADAPNPMVDAVDENGKVVRKRNEDFRALQAADAKIKAVRQRIAQADAKAVALPRLTARRIETVLAKDYGRAKLVSVPRPKLALAKNGRAEDALPELQDATLALHEERREIEKAPLTAECVKKAMRAEIGQLAGDGLPKTLAMFTGHRPKIGWAQHQLPVVPGSGLIPNVPDGVALICFLLKDTLIEALDKLIDVNAEAFSNSMTPEQKAARLADLDKRIDEAERIEATCVEQVIAEGGDAFHRHDASVLAVLSLRVA
jgi:hypothetical protein